MTKTLNLNFEKAVRLLTAYMPPSDENSRKPILFHDIRVGVYLYENDYAQDVVLAGVLHDAIEWSKANEKMLRDEFGDNVVRLVLASTKDDSIADKEEKTIELIKRCVQNGQDALIVKTADILDSFKWYSRQDNKNELQYCMRNANAIFKFKPNNFDDKIFNELKVWQDKYADLSK
ncbi:HD domain-containing protein [Candidatus Uhrbacteria bacterium]|nr:HD domain-containing protein [Candidatus Uhrbacteria bacterium]